MPRRNDASCVGEYLLIYAVACIIGRAR